MKRPPPALAGQFASARALALQVLSTSQVGEHFAQDVLHQALEKSSNLSAADRRLATQLVFGVLRRRDTLDALVQSACSRPRFRVEPRLWDVLLLGAFQLALLTHIPPHAAVHETVALAGSDRRSRGFINGILRALTQLLTDERTDRPAADAVPLEGGQYRKLARPVLPDPAADPVQYVAAAFALPRWLTVRWQARYPWEECLRLGFWFAAAAPLWLRSNRLRTTREELLARLTKAGIAAQAGEYAEAIRLTDGAVIRELPGYEQGWFSVQDESAMRVAAALSPAPGSRVLDLCSAPGGKTTHLAELMQNQGQIIACDVDDARLRTVAELCRRLGITIVETHRLTADPPPGPFDAILVDAPCSNTGVLGRRPEVRWRLKPGELPHLVRLQTKLLLQAAERIRPGGAIVYSTCSFEPEENGGGVRAVLQALPDLKLEAEQEQVPGLPADGGYWARLRRKK
jgi:16S rRNA (cytosine967-C5)-methyltransferase